MGRGPGVPQKSISAAVAIVKISGAVGVSVGGKMPLAAKKTNYRGHENTALFKLQRSAAAGRGPPGADEAEDAQLRRTSSVLLEGGMINKMTKSAQDGKKDAAGCGGTNSTAVTSVDGSEFSTTLLECSPGAVDSSESQIHPDRSFGDSGPTACQKKIQHVAPLTAESSSEEKEALGKACLADPKECWFDEPYHGEGFYPGDCKSWVDDAWAGCRRLEKTERPLDGVANKVRPACDQAGASASTCMWMEKTKWAAARANVTSSAELFYLKLEAESSIALQTGGHFLTSEAGEGWCTVSTTVTPAPLVVPNSSLPFPISRNKNSTATRTGFSSVAFSAVLYRLACKMTIGICIDMMNKPLRMTNLRRVK
ncbi:unnamed protein product [Amoebophrya sp. A120]|nr:unnamed protein product [Amoebophrya sp. A120]|eukprot:GSA120T00014197001.1